MGIRSFDSMDLIRELPLTGLPEFCHSIYSTGEPLLVQDSHGFPAATTVDVQSADVPAGSNVLVLKLNKYAADLVIQAANAAGPLMTLLCFNALSKPEIAKDTDGVLLLTYLMSSSRAIAEKERACVINAFAHELKH